MVFTAIPDEYVMSESCHWFLSYHKQTTVQKNVLNSGQQPLQTVIHIFSFTPSLFLYNYPFYGPFHHINNGSLGMRTFTARFNCWLFTSYNHNVTGSVRFTYQTKTKIVKHVMKIKICALLRLGLVFTTPGSPSGGQVEKWNCQRIRKSDSESWKWTFQLFSTCKNCAPCLFRVGSLRPKLMALSVFRDGLSTVFWVRHLDYANHLHAVHASQIGNFFMSRSIRGRVFSSVRTAAFTHDHIPLKPKKM